MIWRRISNAMGGSTLPLSAAQSPTDSESSGAWNKACESYQECCKHQAMPHSEVFKYYGSLHLAVAEILWEQRDDIRSHGAHRVVHLSSATGLVAVYSMKQRSVQLRMQSTALSQVAHAGALSLRMLPSSADALKGDIAKDFQTVSLTSLLWHYAQCAPLALEQMPRLQKQWLILRQFPALSPASLQLRHLSLIHRLSRESLSFEQLQANCPPEDAVWLCPDVAALYFTGALRLEKQPI